MLTTIAMITSLGLAIFYPLCFLIHSNSPIGHRFHRFHLGMPLVVGGVVSVCLLTGPIAPLTKCLLMVWFLLLAFLTFFYWEKEYPQAGVITIPSLVGFLAFTGVQLEFLNFPLEGRMVMSGVLAGLILCAALHSMTLGHHYLNVRGLPIKHLRTAVYVLWGLLGLRILWDSYFLFYGRMLYRGDVVPLIRFLMGLDGFLLWVGILFGTLFPFAALFFVKEILKLKNTQAATGILYVVLCSVFMGDLTYTYYLVKFGVAL